MHIESIKIKNFRRLKDVRIDLAHDISIFVGANNSGKTSAAHIIDMFLGSSREDISLYDFNSAVWSEIDAFGAESEGAVLPSMSLDIWMHVGAPDLHRAIDLLPSLDWTGSRVGVRILFCAKDPQAALANYKALYAKAREGIVTLDGALAHEPYPRNFREYLTANLTREYERQYFVLDHTKYDDDLNEIPPYSPRLIVSDQGRSPKEILGSLIRVDFLGAQRNLNDRSSGGRAEEISRRMSRFYRRNLEQGPSDFSAMKALDDAVRAMNQHLQHVFQPTLDQLGHLGYPGVNNPHLLIKTELDPVAVMSSQGGARVHYALDPPVDGVEPTTLPDQYNGLGYKNLIYMVVELLDAHAQWASIEENRPPLHFIIIEEPEAHLHAQLQQVFISQVFNLLKQTDADAALYSNQIVVTTHSPHVVYERGFRPIRYFNRIDDNEKHYSVVKSRKRCSQATALSSGAPT